MIMYLVLSAFTSSPISLLTSATTSQYINIIDMNQKLKYTI